MSGKYYFYDTERNPRCTCGKVGFDKRGAQTKKNLLEKRGNEKQLRIYPCPESKLWHLTKVRKWNQYDKD